MHFRSSTSLFLGNNRCWTDARSQVHEVLACSLETGLIFSQASTSSWQASVEMSIAAALPRHWWDCQTCSVEQAKDRSCTADQHQYLKIPADCPISEGHEMRVSLKILPSIMFPERSRMASCFILNIPSGTEVSLLLAAFRPFMEVHSSNSVGNSSISLPSMLRTEMFTMKIPGSRTANTKYDKRGPTG